MENNLIKKEDSKIEKKIDFAKKREHYLFPFEVEHFLCDFKRILKAVKLYHILK